MSPPGRARPAAGRAFDGAAIGLLRLARLVRIRRLLRSVCWAGGPALVAWLLVLVVGQGVTDDESGTYRWLGDHGNQGFVVILAVLALALLSTAAIRFLGPAGAAAARLLPLIGSGADPLVGGGRSQPAADQVLALGQRPKRGERSGRSTLGSLALLALLLAFAAGSAYTAHEVGPAYRASHGHGGPVITLGQDGSKITRFTPGRSNGYSRDTYYVSSPRGEAVVAGYGRPHDGDRFTVVRSGGVLRAYHVGGRNYVTDAVLAGVFFVLGVLVAVGLVVRLRRRHREGGPVDGRVQLETTVERLQAGKPAGLWLVPRSAKRAGAHLALALPRTPAGVSSPEEIVARTRGIDRLLAVALLVVLALAGVVVALAG